MKSLKKWLFAEPLVKQGDIHAALDVGSSKIACFIARSDNPRPRRALSASAIIWPKA